MKEAPELITVPLERDIWVLAIEVLTKNLTPDVIPTAILFAFDIVLVETIDVLFEVRFKIVLLLIVFI
jgi:hypothetical protein